MLKGFEGAVRLAEAFGTRAFNHVSTAYVAGRMTGRVAEAVDPRPRSYNNVYEQSKHLCESIVAEHCGARDGIPDLPAEHRDRTFADASLVGRRGLVPGGGLRGAIRPGDAGEVIGRRSRPDAQGAVRPRGQLNLIPVNIAIAEMLDLAALGERTLGEVFHVTSESPIGVRDVIGTTLELVGIERFEVVGPGTELDYPDRMFYRSLKFFAPNFGRRKIFERNNVARSRRDRHQLGYLLDVGRLREFIGHHLAKRRSSNRRDRCRCRLARVGDRSFLSSGGDGSVRATAAPLDRHGGVVAAHCHSPCPASSAPTRLQRSSPRQR